MPMLVNYLICKENKTMSQGCKYLILHCTDFRLQSALEEWKKTKGISGDVDVLAIAGACKDLANYGIGTCEANHIMAMISLAYEKHGMRNVILTQHQDCDAYGGQSTFADDKAEKNKLMGDMIKVRKALLDKFPDLRVEMFWVKMVREGWEFEAVSD